MGYFKHESLTVICADSRSPRIERFRENLPEELRHYLVGPVDVVNGYCSWCFLPDGSKEGWSASDLAHEWRIRLAELCDEIFADWSYAEFSGDDDMQRLVTNKQGWESI